MYKAVFIDVDGTLIRKDHSVSDFTKAVIHKLTAQGILVVLVSARPLSGIIPIAEKTGLQDNPIASLNGSYISCDGKIIFNSIVRPQLVSAVHKTLRPYTATSIYYQQEEWFSEVKNKDTDHEQKITAVPVTVQSFNKTLQNWQSGDNGPNKILLIAEEPAINEMQETLKNSYSDHLNIATSKPTFLEIISKEASKKNAVRLLMERYHLKQEEIIAIGDNFNDKEMIEFAGFGIAMENAPDEVKAVADYVTASNNDDGVARALEDAFKVCFV